jgi:hypothetical protein
MPEAYRSLRPSELSFTERVVVSVMGDRITAGGNLRRVERALRRDPSNEGLQFQRGKALIAYHEARRADRIERREHLLAGVTEYDEAREKLTPMIRRFLKEVNEN